MNDVGVGKRKFESSFSKPLSKKRTCYIIHTSFYAIHTPNPTLNHPIFQYRILINLQTSINAIELLISDAGYLDVIIIKAIFRKRL